VQDLRVEELVDAAYDRGGGEPGELEGRLGPARIDESGGTWRIAASRRASARGPAARTSITRRPGGSLIRLPVSSTRAVTADSDPVGPGLAGRVLEGRLGDRVEPRRDLVVGGQEAIILVPEELVERLPAKGRRARSRRRRGSPRSARSATASTIAFRARSRWECSTTSRLSRCRPRGNAARLALVCWPLGMTTR